MEKKKTCSYFLCVCFLCFGSYPSGELEAAKAKLKMISDPSIKEWNRLVLAAGKLSGLQAAHEVMEEMVQNGMSADTGTYRSLVEVGEDIVQVEEEMRRRKIKFNEVRGMISRERLCGFSDQNK